MGTKYTADDSGNVDISGMYKQSGSQIDSGDLADSASLIKTSTSLSGDLSGSLPSATVAKLNGVSVTGTPASTDVLAATGATSAAWESALQSFINGSTLVLFDANGDLIAADTGSGFQFVWDN